MFLNLDGGFEVVGKAEDGKEAVELARASLANAVRAGLAGSGAFGPRLRASTLSRLGILVGDPLPGIGGARISPKEKGPRGRSHGTP